MRVSGDIMELTEAWEIVKKQKGNVRLIGAEKNDKGEWVIAYVPLGTGYVVYVHPDGTVD